MRNRKSSLIFVNYSPLKIVDEHEEFISLNKINKIINNLEIKKVSGIDQINNIY